MSYVYSREELTEYFFRALDVFNERLGTDISKKTVHLTFFMPQNGQAVYESFCKAFFPGTCRSDIQKPGILRSLLHRRLWVRASMAL